jgi:hypothetical protein
LALHERPILVGARVLIAVMPSLVAVPARGNDVVASISAAGLQRDDVLGCDHEPT